MNWQQLNEGLSFISRDFAGHGVDLFRQEIILIHEYYPHFSDATKECMNDPSTPRVASDPISRASGSL